MIPVIVIFEARTLDLDDAYQTHHQNLQEDGASIKELRWLMTWNKLFI